MGPGKHEAHQGTKSALIGLSPQMQRVYRLIRHASACDHAVLVIGERGTEKDLAARTIHALGPRKDRPFIAMDCASLPPTLVESELFGYAKGAFYTASEAKWGRLAFAGGGTVFLDEIDLLPHNFQGKLLRTLQEGQFLPVGSVHPLPFGARLIAATQRDLSKEVKAGNFREDLYGQLNLAPIRLPPLRERKGDIRLLAELLVERYAGQSRVEFSADAMEYLMSHNWPGNLRELDDLVRRAISIASEGVIRASDLGGPLREVPNQTAEIRDEPFSLDDIERGAICRALRLAAGDPNAAARLLRVGKPTLDRKMKYYGMLHAGGGPRRA
jgi:DNA-binding NtrC family response regulator